MQRQPAHLIRKAHHDRICIHGITQQFCWSGDPWMVVHVIEKIAGSIRRVKAKTFSEVEAKLFIQEEAESAPEETVGAVADSK